MPNDQVLMVCAFIYGYFDGTLNTMLTTMIGLSFTTEKDASGAISFNRLKSLNNLGCFVIFNIVQCLAGSAAFFYSEFLLLPIQSYIVIGSLIISLATFLKLDLDLQR